MRFSSLFQQMNARVAFISLLLVVGACAPALAVVPISLGLGYVTNKLVTNPVVSARTGSVALDSVTMSQDSTRITVQGLLTWKKAMTGPNNTTYLNLDPSAVLMGAGQQGATGSFQVDLIGADGKVLNTVGPSKVTVWDGKDPIVMIPAGKPFRFSLQTTPVAWNILRDTKSKVAKFVVLMR